MTEKTMSDTDITSSTDITDRMDINEIEIVPMDISYLDEVAEIEEDSFSLPWSKKELEREITTNNLGIYIAARHKGHVVGYAGMWHVVTEGHITNVAVKESYRRCGVGTKLVLGLVQIAQEREMIGITLEVRIGNLGAQRLYTKHGFKPEGFRKNYYSDTNEDAVIMWKYLS